MADHPLRERLLPVYRDIYAWYRTHASRQPTGSSSDYRERSQGLIANLPEPAAASIAEIRAVLHEVRSGLLEWAYGEKNGERMNGDIAAEALDASGGYPTESEKLELSAESPLWRWLTLGRAAQAFDEALSADAAGETERAARLFESSIELAERQGDPVTGARVALAFARRAGIDPQEALQHIERGLKLAVEAPPPARRELESEFRQLLAEKEGAGTGDQTTKATDGVPFDLAQYELSPAVAEILGRAAARAATVSPPVPVTTSLVLFEMAAAGRAVRDPQWIADFLRLTVSPYEPHFGEMRAQYFQRYGLTSAEGQARSTQMTAGVRHIVSAAGQIAQRTSRAPTIHGRHLLAALIIDRAPGRLHGAAARLGEVGIDVPLLRQRLCDWVRGYGDDDVAWRALLLGTDAGPRRLATFQADDTRGPDLLDIEREVVALATLIAARSVSPPLSIGLFGDWGSGKTFFMRQLRRTVAKLSKEARESETMQRDEPFYKRIVQIEFNAWHYVEGNLWASLVEHIFDHLHLPEDERPTAIAAMQKHWIERLGFAESAMTAANERQAEASRRVDRAQTAVDDAKREHDRKKADLQRFAAQNVARDFRLSGAYAVVATALAPLGLQPVGDSATDLESSLREARGLLAGGRSVFTALLHAPDRSARWRSLLTIAVGAPAVAAAMGIGLTMLGAERIAQVSAFATGAATLLATGARWVRTQTSWMSAALGKVEEAQRVYDQDLARALAATARDIARTEQELALTREEYAAAQQRVDEARRAREAAATDLSKATSTRLLAHFIQDRAASGDYRRHLGVLALVRDDFEKLSDMIEEENWRLSPPEVVDERFARVAKFSSPAEEARDAAVRINRIVLYIDDLDRCPPAKVVDVLQAVHLLLAFPLFVVVVGVDARWVTRSLWTRYRELLHLGAGETAADPAQMFGVARAEDYLEKIFQIPLWLRPIGPGGARRLVQGMVRGASRATSGDGRDGSDRTGRNDEATGGAAGSAGARGDARGAAAASASPGEGRSSDVPPSAPASETVGQERRQRVAPAPAVPNVESLEINEVEIRTIDDLSPLLGRSPRSIKRFVNIYRLVKAGLTPAELRVFMGANGDTLNEYEAVLFLLAVDTGLPELAGTVFDVLRQCAREGLPEPAPPNTVDWLIARVQNGLDPSAAEEWRNLVRWLEDHHRSYGPFVALRRLVEWAPSVARYSFQAPDVEQEAPRAEPRIAAVDAQRGGS